MLAVCSHKLLEDTYRAHKRAAWWLSQTSPEWAAAHYRVAIELCEALIIVHRLDWCRAQALDAEREGLAFCLGELEKGPGKGTICGRLLPEKYKNPDAELQRLHRLMEAAMVKQAMGNWR